jgi:hypothetical protein
MLNNTMILLYVMPGRGKHWKVGGLKDSTVTSADIKNATIKAEDAQIFVSAETAATGSAQNIAHGLTGTPSKVFVTLTEFGGSTACDVALGTHTSTNCVVTITAGVKFQVWAMI